MRIWILTSELADELAGGIARYVSNFSGLLAAAGHEVLVIASTLRACDYCPTPGVRVIGFVPRRAHLGAANPTDQPDTHPAYPYNVLSYWPALSYQMAEEVLRLLEQLPRPDIIESQEYGALPYYLLQRKLTERTPLEQIPILVAMHGAYFDVGRVNQEPRYRFPLYWVGQMEKFCLAAADGLHSPSQFLARSSEQSLGRSLDVAVIPHPLPNLASLPPCADPLRGLVYVGRLEVRKGVLPLVQACSRLWAAGQGFRLTMIGGDVHLAPQETTVGTFIRERHAAWIESGHLRLLGELDHAAVLQRMREAWAAIVPSLWEPFGLTCMEAMAVGQVVLASRAGGPAEMIGDPQEGEESGFLFDWQAPFDFDRQLARVLALSQGERQAIAGRAQTRIHALCSPEVVVPQRLRHYESVINRHQPRGMFPVSYGIPHSDFATSNLTVPAHPPSAADSGQTGLLSVIVTYRDGGEKVQETLASILSSGYSPLEVVIVACGDPAANGAEDLREIEARHLGNVRVVWTDTGRLASARHLTTMAVGEFVALLDGDGLVEPEYFERAVAVLERFPNVAFVYPWVRCFGASTDIRPTWNAEFPYLLSQTMLLGFAVVRRVALLNHTPNEPDTEDGSDHLETWISLLEAGAVGVSFPSPLAGYRVRPEPLGRPFPLHARLHADDTLTQRHEAVYRRWGPELHNLQRANGPGHLWQNPAAEAMDWRPLVDKERRIEELQAWIEEMELGKAWLEREWEYWQRVAAERQARIEVLEHAKSWLAKDREQMVAERDQAIRDLQRGRWYRLGLRLGIVRPFDPDPRRGASEGPKCRPD